MVIKENLLNEKKDNRFAFNYYSLHYHMKSGGVKIVIENLMNGFSKTKDINFFNSFTLLEGGQQFSYNVSSPLFSHQVIPELDYNDKFFSSIDELNSFSKKLAFEIKNILDFTKPCVLHVHNVNLFKNSYLGRSLEYLALEIKSFNKLIILCQVHDFAEDNRNDRLNLLRNCSGEKNETLFGNLMYPQADNIFYLTINSRDKRLLKKIGISEDKIYLFSNCVNVDLFSKKPIMNDDILYEIEKYAKKNNYNFSLTKKILVYPVKILKRKNIVEAILLLKLLNYKKEDYQLLITLDASSKDDIEYSNSIKEYIRKNNLPVVIGFGFEIISPKVNRTYYENGKIREYILPDLFYHATGIMSTSTLEGFGFSFIEGWLCDRQIFGRRINFIIEDFEKQELEFKAFYSKINLTKNLLFEKKIIDSNSLENFDLIDEIDFCNLSFKEQLNFLDVLDDQLYSDIFDNNDFKNFFDYVKNPLTNIISKNKSIVKAEYNLEKYILKLQDIIFDAFEKLSCFICNQDSDVIIDTKKINNKFLVDYFCKLNSLKSKGILNQNNFSKIVLTDLDATLLDHNTYSFEKAKNALNKCLVKNVPVCYCTSKSFHEIEYFREKMKNVDPFISENGSAIYVPKKYFSYLDKLFEKVIKNKINDKNDLLENSEKNIILNQLIYLPFDLFNKIINIRILNNYFVFELNVSHNETYDILKKVQKQASFDFKIYTDFSDEELIKLTGQNKEQAKLSKIKYYADGCMIPEMNESKLKEFSELSKKHDFDVKVGGRFVGINKGCDKGVATRFLISLFLQKNVLSEFMGLGDSPNDISMLKNVDYPILVKKTADSDLKFFEYEHSLMQDLKFSKKVGPEAWNNEVLKFLS